jgi:hypothetical protein
MAEEMGVLRGSWESVIGGVGAGVVVRGASAIASRGIQAEARLELIRPAKAFIWRLSMM